MNKTLLTTICLVSAATGGSISAQILSESFTYADGNLTAVSGGNWANFSGTGTFIPVSSGVVSLNGGSGSREDVTRALGSAYTSGSLFASFSVSLTGGTAPTTGTQSYFLTFKDATTSGFRGRVFVAAPITSGFRLGLENDGNDTVTSTVFTSDLSIASTHSVTLAYNITAGTSKLWVDTATSNAPTLVDNTAATALAGGLTSIALRQATVVYSGLKIDNLTVTDNLAAVPEPGEWAAISGVGLLGFALLRRRNK